MTPGLFYAKSNNELHTKIENNTPRFPTVNYMPTNDGRFRRYNFRTTMELLKLYCGQIVASKEKSIWDCLDGTLPWIWRAKRWTTLPAFHWLLIQLHLTNGLEVTEFQRSTSLLNSVSEQNNGWTELNFWPSDLPKLRKCQIPLL
jgi:hypothetical protein